MTGVSAGRRDGIPACAGMAGMGRLARTTGPGSRSGPGRRWGNGMIEGREDKLTDALGGGTVLQVAEGRDGPIHSREYLWNMPAPAGF